MALGCPSRRSPRHWPTPGSPSPPSTTWFASPARPRPLATTSWGCATTWRYPNNDYAAHMSTTWYDTVATLVVPGGANRPPSTWRPLVWVARLPSSTANRQGVRHPRSPFGRDGPCWGWAPGMFKPSSTRWAWTTHKRGAGILDDDPCCGAVARSPTRYVSHSGRGISAYDDMGVGATTETRVCRSGLGGSGRGRRGGAAGRLGDGWVPMGNPVSQYPEILDTIRTQRRMPRGRADASLRHVGNMPPWCVPGGLIRGRRARRACPRCSSYGAEALADSDPGRHEQPGPTPSTSSSGPAPSRSTWTSSTPSRSRSSPWSTRPDWRRCGGARGRANGRESPGDLARR